tara:strand:+ start:975 stop:1700 length:726 start_codon:yes stop_codon:yes gene_type:complete
MRKEYEEHLIECGGNAISAYSAYLKDKKIALVGPSDSLDEKDEEYGKYLDNEYDLIVRINRCQTGNSKGNRTDIVYLGSWNTEIEKQISNLRSEVVMLAVYGCFTEETLELYAHLKEDIDILKETSDINEEMGHRCNSGFIAMIHLLKHDIKELFVTGFDFHRRNYSKYERHPHSDNLDGVVKYFKSGLEVTNGLDGHKPDSDYRHFKYEMLPNDNRIIPDEALLKILEDPKNDNIHERTE